MTTKWEKIAARKRQRKLEQAQGLGQDWMVWRSCGVCGKKYCANNYSDHKTRVKKWHGVEVCAWCISNVISQLPNLMKLGIIKWTKEHKPK